LSEPEAVSKRGRSHPYTRHDFRRDVAIEEFTEMTAVGRRGWSESCPREELANSLPLEDFLKYLPIETIEKYLQPPGKAASSYAEKSRGSR
jgi:hypothetical protein